MPLSRTSGSRTGAHSRRDKRAEFDADLFDREPATPDEAREMFGLKGRAGWRSSLSSNAFRSGTRVSAGGRIRRIAGESRLATRVIRC